jgi:hypothetical protein
VIEAQLPEKLHQSRRMGIITRDSAEIKVGC